MILPLLCVAPLGSEGEHGQQIQGEQREGRRVADGVRLRLLTLVSARRPRSEGDVAGLFLVAVDVGAGQIAHTAVCRGSQPQFCGPVARNVADARGQHRLGAGYHNFIHGRVVAVKTEVLPLGVVIGEQRRLPARSRNIPIQHQAAPLPRPLHAVKGKAVGNGVFHGRGHGHGAASVRINHGPTGVRVNDDSGGSNSGVICIRVQRHGARLHDTAEILVSVAVLADHRIADHGPALGDLAIVAVEQRAEAGIAVIGGGILQENRQVAIVVLGVGIARAGAEVFAGPPVQRGRKLLSLFAADLLAGKCVGPLAVVFPTAELQRAEQVGEERAADAPRKFQCAVLGGTRPGMAAPPVARRAGDEVESAGVGVAPVERALRPLDHLDPRNLVHIETLDIALVIDAIHKVGRARFHAGLHPRQNARLPANYRPLGAAPESAREAEPRREARHIVHAVHAEGADGLLAEYRNRHRRFPQVLPDLAGGDDDLLDLLRGGICRRLCPGGRLGGGGRGQRRQQQRRQCGLRKAAEVGDKGHGGLSSGARGTSGINENESQYQFHPPRPRPLHPRGRWDTRGPMGRTAFRYRSYWFAPGVGEGRAAT